MNRRLLINEYMDMFLKTNDEEARNKVIIESINCLNKIINEKYSNHDYEELYYEGLFTIIKFIDNYKNTCYKELTFSSLLYLRIVRKLNSYINKKNKHEIDENLINDESSYILRPCEENCLYYNFFEDFINGFVSENKKNVCALLIEGYSVKEISNILNLSTTRIHQIYELICLDLLCYLNTTNYCLAYEDKVASKLFRFASNQSIYHSICNYLSEIEAAIFLLHNYYNYDNTYLSNVFKIDLNVITENDKIINQIEYLRRKKIY